jgi:adenylate cyclase
MARFFDYSKTPTQPLGKVLVKEKVITPDQLQQALEIQKDRPERIGRIIVGEGFATEGAVLEGIVRHYRISARALSDDLEALIKQRPLTLKEKLARVRVPIRVKLSIAITFVIWATILILSFIVLARQKEQLYRQTVRAGKISLNYFVNNASIPLLNDDLLRLNTLIKEAASVEGLLYAIIVDRSQSIKAHTDQTRIGTTLPPFNQPSAVKTESGINYFSYKGPGGSQVLDLYRPVTFRTKELGVVHVGVSLDFINALIRKASVSILVLSFFIVLLGISIAVLLGIGFSRPISKLVLATEEIGKGNFHYRLDMVRKDEFGDLASAFNFMARELYNKLLLQKSFGSYVSPEVLDMILSRPEESWLKGTLHEVSILVTDVRGFTTYSESRAPETVVEDLNEYFRIATQSILEQGGYIDKFIGDGVLAVFGAPVPKPDHARRAVQSAWAMQEALSEQAQKSKNPLLARVGIGINSGVVVSGNLGSQVKMEYTVIGDNVNVASRLNGLAGSGEIIISQSCYEAAGNLVEVEILPSQKLKGKTELTGVYRVVGVHQPLDPMKKERTT